MRAGLAGDSARAETHLADAVFDRLAGSGDELRDDLVQAGAVHLDVGRLPELAGEDDPIRDDQSQQLERVAEKPPQICPLDLHPRLGSAVFERDQSLR